VWGMSKARFYLDSGVSNFLKRKQIHNKDVDALLVSFAKESGFDYDVRKISRHIQDNFSRFAQFTDSKLKSGALRGDDSSLEGYHYQQKLRRKQIEDEFKSVQLTDSENDMLAAVHSNKGRDALQSVLSKRGMCMPPSGDFVSRYLRNLPPVRLAISVGITVDDIK